MAVIVNTETPTVQVPQNPVTSAEGGAEARLAGRGTGDHATDAYFKTPGAKNSITIYRYPQELASDEQYPHYLMFYVNAREDSASAIAGAKRGTRTDNIGDQTNQMRLDPAHTAAALGVGGAVTIGLVGAKQGVKTLADQLTGRVPLSVSVIGKTLAGAAGAVAGAVVGGGLGMVYGDLTKRGLVKIRDVIALHINNSPSVAYKANWSEADMGFAGAVGSGRIEDINLTEMGGGLDLVARAMAAGVPKAAGGPNLKDLMEAGSRKVSNPYKEQLFKSMGMRQFAFDYTFMPKSPQEARNVLNIIRIFKRNMHPEMDKSKLFLVYPSEFSIVYYYKDNENPFINKISSCVLTDMNVRFGDERDFTTFAGGFPTLISMKLQFLELEMLTGERVDNDVEYASTTFGF